MSSRPEDPKSKLFHAIVVVGLSFASGCGGAVEGSGGGSGHGTASGESAGTRGASSSSPAIASSGSSSAPPSSAAGGSSSAPGLGWLGEPADAASPDAAPGDGGPLACPGYLDDAGHCWPVYI